MGIIDHGWKGVKARMTHQVKEEKLTTMAVHIQRSHVEKPTRHLFVITNGQGPNHNLQERRLQTAGTHTAEIPQFLFQAKQDKTYNLNNKETVHASSSGRLPSHMKGKIGWSQESSKYADGLQSSHPMCVPCIYNLNLC